MSLKNLANKWTLPDRTGERKACSLRINFDTYAKCLALKETFPNQSLNDILNDLIENGVDEVVAALPSYSYDLDDCLEAAHHMGGRPEDYEGEKKGPAMTYRMNYVRILNDKTNLETQAEQQDEAA